MDGKLFVIVTYRDKIMDIVLLLILVGAQG